MPPFDSDIIWFWPVRLGLALVVSHASRPSGGDAMKLPRRQFLRFAAGAAALPFSLRRGRAEVDRPTTLVVPIAAGGASDTAARIIAEKLQEKLHQTVVVE